MKKSYSAYCINHDGLLVYTGGVPTDVDDLTIEHFNGKPYSSFRKFDLGVPTQYEVLAITKHIPKVYSEFGYIQPQEETLHLAHGLQIANKLNVLYHLINNCYKEI